MVKEKTIIYSFYDVYVQVRGSNFSQPIYVLSEQCQHFRPLDFAGPKWKLQFKQFEAINYMLASSCFLFRCQYARMIMGQMTSLYLTWHFCFVHTISQFSLPIKQKWLG